VIREANEADISRIVEMGSRSLMEGAYRDQVSDNPEQTKKFALQVMQQGKILVAEEEDRLVGLLAFILFPHYFSGEPTAGEVMWYVEPEHRPGGIALKLLWAAEELAKTLGAVRMQMTSPTADVASIYQRFGYKQIEVSYQKELQKCR
jgi:GNAT superfamily N-acetyltransferase